MDAVAALQPVAVEGAFGADIDFAVLIKHYGEPVGALGRYSPGECVGNRSAPR
jgi:hypothetical protein